MVGRARRRGLLLSWEVTPHHLVLTDEEVARTVFSTQCKMKPPLRSERDRRALLAGGARGAAGGLARHPAAAPPRGKGVRFEPAPFRLLGARTQPGRCLLRAD